MRGVEVPAQLLTIYLLLHLRFVGMIFSSSLFVSTMSPASFRYLFAVLLTAASVGTVAQVDVPLFLFENLFSMAFAALRELLIGLVLGFLSSLPLVALRIAGEQVGTVMGFSMAQVVDPMTQSQDSLVGQLNFLVGMWFYFHWNGHLLMVRAMIETLRFVPLGGLSIFPHGDVAVGTWLQGLFILAMRIVIPFYCALMLADIGLGFLARTVPQMNIFVLGLPVKVALGLTVLAVVLPVTVDLIFTQLERWIEFAMGGVLFWHSVF